MVCGILTARLVLAEGGVDSYALMSVLVALPSLVSFTDLGSGATIVNGIASSEDIRADVSLRRRTTTVMRIMIGFAIAVVIIDVALLVSGGWQAVLGAAGSVPYADLAAFVCVGLFSITICFGAWSRVLLGLRRNPIIILLQGLVSPIALLIVWVLLSTGDETLTSFVALGSFTASLVVGIVGTIVAIRLSGRLLLDAAREVPRVRSSPGEKVMDVGWPMMAQLLSSPVSMALPRYILAALATQTAVAQYGLAGQVFFALQGLVAAAGAALWPHFTRLRSRGRIPRREPFTSSAIMAGMIAVITIVILLIGPWLFGLISSGKLEITSELILWFGAMITAQAALYPLGMFLMDTASLRFQIAPSLLMAASTVGLTFMLTPSLGVIGPLVANTISVTVVQVIPYSLYILSHSSRLYGR